MVSQNDVWAANRITEALANSPAGSLSGQGNTMKHRLVGRVALQLGIGNFERARHSRNASRNVSAMIACRQLMLRLIFFCDCWRWPVRLKKRIEKPCAKRMAGRRRDAP